MWDDVVIGTGNKGISSIHVFDILGDHSITQNSVSYWIEGSKLGFSMTVFKNTPEGEVIKRMIENVTTSDEIYEYCDALAIRCIDVKLLYEKIDGFLDKAYLRGKNDKVGEFLSVLEFKH